MKTAVKENKTFKPNIVDTIHTYTALLFKGDINQFWEFECPCGVKVKYPLNEIPTVDTRFPCDNKNHWVIRFEDIK